MSLSKRFLGPNQASLWLLEKLICQNYFQFRILFGILIFGWDLKTDKTTCLRYNALILNIEKTFVRSYIMKNLFLLRSLKSMQRTFDKSMKLKFYSTSWNINFCHLVGEYYIAWLWSKISELKISPWNDEAVIHDKDLYENPLYHDKAIFRCRENDIQRKRRGYVDYREG